MIAPEITPKLILVGAGGHASEILSYIDDLNSPQAQVQLLGVVDDKREPGHWLSTNVLGDITAMKQPATIQEPEVFYLTATGDNYRRRDMVRRVENLGVGFIPWTLVHPNADVGSYVEIGDGSLLAPGVGITTRVTIGRHCILNVKVSVSHDCVVGECVNINPGVILCGNVELGDGAYIGAGAVVKDRVKIGTGAVIGAGAVVIEDVNEDATVVGVPAREIGQSRRHWNSEFE